MTEKLFAGLTGSVIGLYNYYKENQPWGGEFSSSVYSYGFSGTASLMYYLAGLNTVITLGFRYQQIHFIQEDSQYASFSYDGETDRFYGITLSALYMMDL